MQSLREREYTKQEYSPKEQESYKETRTLDDKMVSLLRKSIGEVEVGNKGNLGCKRKITEGGEGNTYLTPEALRTLSISWLTPQQKEWIKQINDVHYETTKDADLSKALSCGAYYLDRGNLTEAAHILARLSDNDLHAIAPFLTNVDLRSDRFREWSAEQIFKFIERCSSLKTLSITHSTITSLPDLPHCEWLNSYYCINLSVIGKTPSLKKLFCAQCLNLKKFPDPSQLEEIDISGTKIRTIGELSKCRRFSCRDCKELKGIEALPLCELFDSYGCTKLESTPESLPHCKYWNSRHNVKLLSLPILPQAEILDCKECSSIKKIVGHPSWKRLDCSDCYRVEQIEGLSGCKNLNITRCREIKIPPKLPEGESIDCHYCDKLEQKPQLALGGKIETEIWFLEPSSIQETPLEILQELGKRIDNIPSFAPIVLINKDGSSYMDNRREVRNYLFNKLLANLLGNREDLFATSLPFLQWSTEERWSLIGKMLMFACKNGIPVEMHFHLEVFEKLLFWLKCSDEEFVKGKEYFNTREGTTPKETGIVQEASSSILQGIIEGKIIDEKPLLWPIFRIAEGIRPFTVDVRKLGPTFPVGIDLRGVSTALELKNKMEGKALKV